MTTDAETIVRRAYHAAEGNVMYVQGFIDLFADDGVFDAVGQESFRGEHLGDPVVFMGKLAPDVHRELHRVNVMGNVVAIELSIRAPSPGRSRRPQASSAETEPSSTSRAPTSGTWRTARSSSSTARSAPASCSNKSAYRPTSRPQSKRRPLPRRPPHSPPGGYQGFFNVIRGDRATISEGKQTFELELRVNTAVKPKQIDTKNLDGPEKGSISVGIYELHGHTLRICHTGKDTPRAREVRDRRGIGIGTRGVEATEVVIVNADRVGTPNHPLQQTGGSPGGPRNRGMMPASCIGICASPPLYVAFQALQERLRPSARPLAPDDDGSRT